MIFKRLYRFRIKLKTKVFIPLVGAAIFLSIIYSLHSFNVQREKMLSALQVRAEILNNSLSSTLEALDNYSEVKRVVSGLGAEKDILNITLIKGIEKPTIIASTKNEWIEKEMSSVNLPYIEYKLINEAIYSNEVINSFDEKEKTFLVVSPILVISQSANKLRSSNAVTLIKMDVSKQMQDIQKETQLNLFYLLVVGFVIVFSLYLVLTRLVVNPLEKMLKVLSARAAGDTKIRLEKTSDDEVGKVAKALNDLFDYVESSSTKEKIKNQELEELNKELKSIAQGRMSFLANMSHEIRTPLNSIIGYGDLLDETPLNDEQRKYLRAFRRTSSNLMAIINDILDFSKIDSGMMTTEKNTFRIHDLVEDLQLMFAPVITNKGLGFDINISADVPEYIQTDIIRLKQILINLIGNANKFTEKGKITVTIQKNSSHLIPGNLIFKVSDTGVGIPANRISMLFNPFIQADHSITRKFGGTGLGLAISARLVQLLGGKIYVDSRQNEGSTFSFTIQANLNVSGEIISKHKSIPVEAESIVVKRRLDILLVDDSDDNRELVKAMLKKSEHIIVEAKHGKEALDLVQKAKFDLVIMDLQMPVMDGLTAVRNIRDLERKKIISENYIVALTAHALEEEKQKCLENGFNDYFTKPIKKQLLLDIVSKRAEDVEAHKDRKTA